MTSRRRPRRACGCRTARPEPSWADLQRRGAAAAGGVRAGDVILSINRVEVGSAAAAVRELNSVESGRAAFLLIQRGDEQVFLQIRKE